MDEFDRRMTASITLVQNANGKVWIGLKKIPIAVFSVVPMFKYVEPHITWFPEASSRDRLEGSVKFLCELKREIPFLIVSRQRDRTFFEHLCKYGVIRTVGKLRDHYGKGGHASLFQSVT
jgi:hypothetical protein